MKRKTIVDLPRLFDDPSGGKSYRIRFGDPTEEVMVGVQGNPVSTVSWVSGVWRLTWSPGRLDVHFDGRGYRDVAERSLALADAWQRIVGPLEAASQALGAEGVITHRLALVAGGEASADQHRGNAVRWAAQRCLSDALCTEADNGALKDVATRIDFGGSFPLVEGDVQVHRLEAVNSVMEFKESKPAYLFSAQWDISTSPIRGAKPIDTGSFAPFFRQGSEWIASRSSDLLEGEGF